jgi:TolA-binding protein
MQAGVLWKVAVVVLLLLSGGGLLAALVLAGRDPHQKAVLEAAGTFKAQQQQLQQQLEAMQERVAVLQRQLSEKELQLAACGEPGGDAAGGSAGMMSGHTEL